MHPRCQIRVNAFHNRQFDKITPPSLHLSTNLLRFTPCCWGCGCWSETGLRALMMVLYQSSRLAVLSADDTPGLMINIINYYEEISLSNQYDKEMVIQRKWIKWAASQVLKMHREGTQQTYLHVFEGLLLLTLFNVPKTLQEWQHSL